MNFSTRKQTMTEQITPHIEKKNILKRSVLISELAFKPSCITNVAYLLDVKLIFKPRLKLCVYVFSVVDITG